MIVNESEFEGLPAPNQTFHELGLDHGCEGKWYWDSLLKIKMFLPTNWTDDQKEEYLNGLEEGWFYYRYEQEKRMGHID